MIQEQVAGPRSKERALIQEGRPGMYAYRCGAGDWGAGGWGGRLGVWRLGLATGLQGPLAAGRSGQLHCRAARSRSTAPPAPLAQQERGPLPGRTRRPPPTHTTSHTPHTTQHTHNTTQHNTAQHTPHHTTPHHTTPHHTTPHHTTPHHTTPHHLRRYEQEFFSVRRKDFWPLWHTRRLVREYMGALAHETDGLILQGFDDYYKPGALGWWRWWSCWRC
jgi:hypothetical protein